MTTSHKTEINMSKPVYLYVTGIGFLMLISLLVSNVSALAFTSYANDFPYRIELCAGLFGFGTLMGVLAWIQHSRRAANPWMLPQSVVALPYSFFFVSTLFATLLMK